MLFRPVHRLFFSSVGSNTRKHLRNARVLFVWSTNMYTVEQIRGLVADDSEKWRKCNK